MFAGTVVLGFDTDFRSPVLGWSYFHGNFYLVYKEILNVLGTALIIGMLVVVIRRAVVRPTKRDYARPDRAPGEPRFDRRLYQIGDWTFLGLLLTIALTGFVLEGVRIATDNPGYGGVQFVGWVVAQPLGGLSHETLAGLRHRLWWFHGLVAIAFVASIPYTNAPHMLTSFASLTLRDPLAGKRLRLIPAERATDPPGYATLSDFSPLHLLQLDACIKCGRCRDVCPATATGRPLSPRDVILELREQSNQAFDALGLGRVLGRLMGHRGADPAAFTATSVLGPEAVRAGTVWSCPQRNACVEVCPVGIEQAPIINQIRRHMVEEGELDANLRTTLQVIHKSGNPFGESPRRRGRWTRELDFEVKDARKESVDGLWVVGDYASFDPGSQRITRSVARLFRAANLNFGILYDGERNSGNDVRRVG